MSNQILESLLEEELGSVEPASDLLNPLEVFLLIIVVFVLIFSADFPEQEEQHEDYVRWHY